MHTCTGMPGTCLIRPIRKTDGEGGVREELVIDRRFALARTRGKA